MRTLRLTALGLLTGTALSWAAAPPPRPASPVEQFLARFDRNKDGVIDRGECPEALRKEFARVDADGDGRLSRKELAAVESRLARFLGNRGRPGEINTPAARGERLPERLKVGDAAPDFTLPLLSGNGAVTLSSFRGKRPVVLIFASYT